MAKKNKSLNFIVKLHLLPFDIMVSYNEPLKSLKNNLKNFGVIKKHLKSAIYSDSTARGNCHMTPNNQTIIRIAKQVKKIDTIGVVVHECHHATNFILNRIGTKSKVGVSEEFYAYMNMYLVTEILKSIKL